MAFIDVVEWSPADNETYAWRYPESNLSTSTQLIVRESQEAVFFSKGQTIGKFGPGRHTLTTENLPLLRRLYGLPFGGTNPFFAEVWFVNETMPLNIDWRTTPMRITDADLAAMVPIVATGRYGVRVTDAERFLIKLIGTMRSFTASDLTDHFMGPLTSKTNSAIASFMTANRVGIAQIAMQLDQLSRFVSEPMAAFWADYGLELVGFFITSIDVDTSTPDGRKIAEAISDRSAQDIAGYTWQQRQTFNVANNAVDNADMGILGMAMIGSMMSGGMGRSVGYDLYGQAPTQPQPGGPSAQGASGLGQAGGTTRGRRQVFCANCGRTFESSDRFCAHCGHEYHPCPLCGADNLEGARRCVTCGAQLADPLGTDVGDACPRCRAHVRAGTRFCPQCGMKLS